MKTTSAQARRELERLALLLQGGPDSAAPEWTVDRVTLDIAARPAEQGAQATRHESVELPAAAVAALLDIARALAEGRTLALVPHGAEITTQAAADLLGVSRPHVVALIDRGELKAHMVGTHRRLLSDDVLDYRQRRAATRRGAVAEAQRRSAELEAAEAGPSRH